MPEKNKTYRARIEGYTSEGLGVARIDGQAVFVHRALRGEDCDVLILKALKNAAFGKAVRVYAPSPHRREPDCPYYGRCGGCDFRHMDREEELEAKRQRVQDALRRIGGSDVAVEGILSGAPLHYRNKSQYPVSADGQVGFYKARSHQVVPVDCCRIQKPQADAAAEALRRYIRECGVPCYDERTGGVWCGTCMSERTARDSHWSACWSTGGSCPARTRWCRLCGRRCRMPWAWCWA